MGGVPLSKDAKEEILSKLTEEDFKGCIITAEPDGDYEVLQVDGFWFFRHMETGKISY